MKNVCIVGYGAIGPIHAAALELIDEANFYAVCDCDEARVLKCLEKYNVVSYTNFSTMLEDPSIDTIHICTPHYLHYEMVKQALEKKKAVVCEKPIAIKEEELKKMLLLPNIEKVAVVFQNRLNTCVRKMKAILEEKTFGEILGVRGLVTWMRDEAYYKADEWRGKWETEGGGVLINQSIHTLDLMGYLAGGFKSVQANMTNYSLKDTIEVEDTFAAYFRMKNDAKAVFFATNAFAMNSSPDVQIVCERGVLHYTDDKLFVDDDIVCRDITAEGEKAYWGTGHIQLLCNYYNEGKYFSVFDAENTMKTAYAMYKSAKHDGAETVI